MKIFLVGYGAMGQNLEKIVREKTNHKIVKILDYTKENGLNFDDYIDFDVLIDFSHPDNLSKILTFIEKWHKPAVLCTTGYTKEQLKQIKSSSQNIPILYSRNMSIGINVMSKIIKEINKALNYQFDIEITETHHNKKLDAPSGTALMLAESLNETCSYNFINRKHINRKRESNEIAIHSLRGGTVAGEHSVFFFGEDEYLEVKHSASSKALFCHGAIRALEYIVHKNKGLYSMDDVINDCPKN